MYATLFVTIFVLHGAPGHKPTEAAIQFKTMEDCQDYFYNEGRVRHASLMSKGAKNGLTLMAKGACQPGLLKDIRPGYPREWLEAILENGEIFL